MLLVCFDLGDPVDLERRTLYVLTQVVRDHVYLMTLPAERFGHPKDSHRGAPRIRKGACRHHRYSKPSIHDLTGRFWIPNYACR